MDAEPGARWKSGGERCEVQECTDARGAANTEVQVPTPGGPSRAAGDPRSGQALRSEVGAEARPTKVPCMALWIASIIGHLLSWGRVSSECSS
jgi:hypothetical protein